MNSSTIAIIFGAAIATGGVTYFITSEAPVATPDAQSPAQASEAREIATSVSTPTAPQPKTSANTSTSGNQASSSATSASFANKPDGISDELWIRAQERAENFASWANRARDSERYRRRLEWRVNNDTQTIVKRLGLPEESSAAVKKILTDRIEASISKANRAADAVMNNPEKMAILAATRELQTSDAGISDELLAKRNATKKELFGEFYEGGNPPESIDVGDLLRPDTPQAWYRDDEFLVAASTEIGASDSASLMDYAGKLDFLDRQDRAFNRVNYIERTVDLQPRQSSALKQLYIDNRSPSDEQISNIVGRQNLNGIKEALNRGRRR